jgi:putative peptidoglycan lipid II flippase
VEKLLLAFFFGTGPEVDAYVVLREVIKPAFLPTFLQSRCEAGGRNWRLFAVMGTLLVLLLGGVTVAGIFLARPLIALAAPGFDGQQRELAVRLLRLVMPALLLLGTWSLTAAALHAHKRFVLPTAGEASFRAVPILLLLATGGVGGTALGMVIGALGKVGLEVWGLRRYLARLRPSLDLAFGPLRTVGRLAAPLLGALFLSLSIGPLVEYAFASKVGVGGVAALAYSRKIAETLTTILPYTLGRALLPFSAEMVTRQDSQGLARTLSGALRGLVLLFLPVILGLMMLREPFVQLLLEKGGLYSRFHRANGRAAFLLCPGLGAL